MSESRDEFFVTVYGVPRPQGSKRHVGNGRLVEASKYLPAWREDVKTVCRVHMMDNQDQRKFTEPVHATLNFYLPRPPSINRAWPSVAPDLDKLCRGVFDALEQSGVIENDALIVRLDTFKQYDDDHPAGVSIYLRNVTV